jgi:hypothetical protein
MKCQKRNHLFHIHDRCLWLLSVISFS